MNCRSGRLFRFLSASQTAGPLRAPRGAAPRRLALGRVRGTALGALLALIGSLSASLPARSARADWRSDYRRGVQALESGRLEAARRALDAAAAARPEPELAARGYGTRSVDYLPSLQLARLAYLEGDAAEAERLLVRARVDGLAERSEPGGVLLRQLELLIENLRFLEAAELGTLSGETAPPRRTERDLQRERLLAAQVAGQCGQPPPERRRRRPWYYHYALAGELAEHGDPVGSLQQLALALERRSEPGELSRTYGMGVVNYRPYFELGRVHARLGNWQCAGRALELSADLEDFVARDTEARRERAELLAGARARQSAAQPVSEQP